MREYETFPGLTGLRFVLALWIAAFHLIWKYGPESLADAWFVSLGNVRADFFFALSGFVLAHVYAFRSAGAFGPGAFGPGAFGLGAFVKARIARIYPLHLLGLGVFAVAVVAAYVLGDVEEASKYTAVGLAANLLLLQAWDVPGAWRWNYPTWALSAEAFSYLLFPAMIVVASRLRRYPLAMWAGVVALTAAADWAFPALGRGPLADASHNFGAIRGALVFAGGVAARYVLERVRLNAWRSVALVCAGVMIGAAAAVRGFDLWVIVVASSVLVVGIAGMDRAGVRTPLAYPVMQRLGEMSYALFCLHVPVFIIVTRALMVAGWTGELGLLSGGFILAVALALGWAAHILVEEPARRAIRTLGAIVPDPVTSQR